jgi:hypothetical protein
LFGHAESDGLAGADGEPDCDCFDDAVLQPDLDPECDTDTERIAESHGIHHWDTDPQRIWNGDSVTEWHANGVSNDDPELHADFYTYFLSEPDADTHADAEPKPVVHSVRLEVRHRNPESAAIGDSHGQRIAVQHRDVVGLADRDEQPVALPIPVPHCEPDDERHCDAHCEPTGDAVAVTVLKPDAIWDPSVDTVAVDVLVRYIDGVCQH